MDKDVSSNLPFRCSDNLKWKVSDAQMLAVLFWDAAADLEKVCPQLLSPILLASSEQHGFYNSDIS